MNVMETLKDRSNVVMTSLNDMGKLAIDKVEEAAKLNLASVSYFSEMGIKQLRAMNGVRDVESMRKFTADTISLSGEIAKRMLDDSKAWMGMGNDIKEKMTDLFAKPDEAEQKKKSPVKSAVS